MMQFLNILGDVMRVATFQWRDERRDARHHEEWVHPGQWAPPADRQPFRRYRP
ncbi:hypothetical protein LB543_26200 [Mesorhizobium sp. ESP7-2]|uniref:hypothetical protein n=1 Tax=Mesorhizobium sp. ESP7-2 TaxID=2876622 RepID=UPI001CCCBA36|nr:hypothetical protein [Mesorhizobium sp. ESP7-2]MBZ9710201.1 hypothetical protein [Mesorhizobium sp. ESP7-2]